MLLAVLVISTAGNTQVIKRIGNRIQRKIENKAAEKIEKEIDNTVDNKGKTRKGKEDSTEEDTNSDAKTKVEETASNTGNASGTEAGAAPAALKSYSKFDFIPGEKIVAYGNFEKDAVGDFPANWNTNASGEVVTLNNKEGKWFKLNKSGIYHPEFITEIPENFTLEFDLGVNNGFSFHSSEIALAIGYVDDALPFTRLGFGPYFDKFEGVRVEIQPKDASLKACKVEFVASHKGNSRISNDVHSKAWKAETENFAHIAIWRQKERFRMYVNNEKVFDLPKGFNMKSTYNALVFSMRNMYKEEDMYLINNIRLAVGAPDTRNKLITEGKFVTRGILFDVNSDRIRPESYGVLKDIATVLSENPTVKIAIIGHTDSDGDDAANMDLSKRRAASVKAALQSEFSISADRMETDGKGESQPVDKNENAEGKANNRRVEFVKK